MGPAPGINKDMSEITIGEAVFIKSITEWGAEKARVTGLENGVAAVKDTAGRVHFIHTRTWRRDNQGVLWTYLARYCMGNIFNK